MCGFIVLLNICSTCSIYRLREERGDERSHSIDQKPRDLSSQNGQ